MHEPLSELVAAIWFEIADRDLSVRNRQVATRTQAASLIIDACKSRHHDRAQYPPTAEEN